MIGLLLLLQVITPALGISNDYLPVVYSMLKNPHTQNKFNNPFYFISKQLILDVGVVTRFMDP